MKKAIVSAVAIVAIIVIGVSIKNNMAPQPAQVTRTAVYPTTNVNSDIKVAPVKTPTVAVPPKTDSSHPTVSTSTDTTVAATHDTSTTLTGKKDRFYCHVNGDGSITYGTQSWHGWWIFGHWEDNPGGITMYPNNPNGPAQACAEFLEAV